MNSIADYLGLPGLGLATFDGTPNPMTLGMEAQRHNADAYLHAMRGMQNAWAPAAHAAHAAQEATDRHYATQRLIAWLRRPDWLYLGFLCSMAGALILRLAFSLH